MKAIDKAIEKVLPVAQGVALWVDRRLYISTIWEHTAAHAVPKSAASWFYVFGSATMLCLILQLITGTLLAFVYVPSGAEAYTTLEYMTWHQWVGWELRAIHNWGSLFMVFIMALHMTQVFLFGAYKYPREMTWITGVLLLFVTLALAFTGQTMRFDQDAYWGLGIVAAITGRSPVIGSEAVHLVLGGPIISGATLSRFFSVHVFILPGTILALLSMHLRLVLVKGINEYPKPGDLVEKETYDAKYAEIIKKEGVPFFPAAISKDLVAGAIVIFGILFCVFFFGAKGPEGPPDPVYIDTIPRPDFPFLWLFAMAALLPDWMEDIFLLGVGPIIAGILFLLPFVSNVGEKSWRRRPLAVITVIFIWLSLGMLTYLGKTSPWSPVMKAWSGTPIAAEYLVDRTPLELQGALVLQNMQCRNCHAIGGLGGTRGPDLGEVGARLNRDQLIRQVIQGGGNMPAYGKNLSPAQVDALVTYMVSLHPPHEAPARNSTFPAEPGKPSGEKKAE